MSELFQLLEAAPWPIPLRRDLLSQVKGTLWHPLSSYGPCMCGRSTGAFRPPRSCLKHYGRSLSSVYQTPLCFEMGYFLGYLITLAYSSLGLQCPIGVRAHSTRGIASSWAWSSGVSISEICEAAGWSSSSTFVRFYNLDVPALQTRVLSV